MSSGSVASNQCIQVSHNQVHDVCASSPLMRPQQAERGCKDAALALFDLVARLDPKSDLKTMTLESKSFWHEDHVALTKPFANAFAKGLVRFAKFVNPKRVTVAPTQPAKRRKQIETMLKIHSESKTSEG